MKSFTQVRMLAVVAIAASVGFSSSAFAHNAKHNAKKDVLCHFAPENDRRIPVNGFEKFLGGIDQQQFNRVIAKVSDVYTPIVKALGATLNFKNLWTDDTVNSSAEQHGKEWVVNAYGGLARHPMMTPDAMAMVFCHEMGHHLGGAPKYSSIFGGNWASNEGQSDYFATAKCWRRLTLQEDNVGMVASMNVPQKVAAECAVGRTDQNEIALCQRGAMVGKILAEVLNDLGKDGASPTFETPDTTQVSKTNDNHPQSQCRLDTYLSGALCTAPYTVEFDKKDATVGACNQEKGDKAGFRPRCWYKAKSGEAAELFI